MEVYWVERLNLSPNFDKMFGADVNWGTRTNISHVFAINTDMDVQYYRMKMLILFVPPEIKILQYANINSFGSSESPNPAKCSPLVWVCPAAHGGSRPGK